MFGQSFGPYTATLSMWFLSSLTLPFGPFTFNPLGFEYTKLIDDWWLGNNGDIVISPDDGWKTWWEGEREHLKYSGKMRLLVELPSGAYAPISTAIRCAAPAPSTCTSNGYGDGSTCPHGHI